MIKIKEPMQLQIILPVKFQSVIGFSIGYETLQLW